MSKVCFPKWETCMAGDFLLSPPEFIFYFNCENDSAYYFGGHPHITMSLDNMNQFSLGSDCPQTG